MVMTAASLRSLTCKDLAKLAKRDGVVGWHSMRKEELVRALLATARCKARSRVPSTHRKGPNQVRANRGLARQAAESRRRARTAKKVLDFQSTQKLLKLLAASEHEVDDFEGEDRLVLMVRDPYWLQACWELRRKSVERAAVALGKNWHDARPVLRLLAAGRSASEKSVERILRDIPIHGRVKNWYIDVSDPPSSYQVKIGYLAGEHFHSLACSNVVTTRPQGYKMELDQNWQDVARQCDKIYAMSGGLGGNGDADQLRELFEERLRRPMGAPLVTRYGIGADGRAAKRQDFAFEVDSELLVYGVTTPGSQISFRGEPIDLREDGTFTVRVSLKDGRQVIPIIATRADGVEQQTVVLAVERNTKVLETLIREVEDIAGS
jgi:hypothetical protein